VVCVAQRDDVVGAGVEAGHHHGHVVCLAAMHRTIPAGIQYCTCSAPVR
jgi:hypothetical protein